MNFQQKLQDAADTGHRQKIEDDRAAEAARVAAAERRLAAEIEAVASLLHALPERMRDAARRGKTVCSAHNVPVTDINLAIAFKAGCPLLGPSLTGVSRRLYDSLQELRLSPFLAVIGPNEHQIEVPVLPPAAASK